MTDYEDYWRDWKLPITRGEEREFESDLIQLIVTGLRDDKQSAIDCAFDKIREWYLDAPKDMQ